MIAITGSYAKTSTKHVLAKGLANQLNVVSNFASYNVIDGIRSTMQRVKSDTDVVIQELGASGPNTLNVLLIRTLPTIGVLTAIADDHRSAFRTREATLKEKFKIVESLPPEGTAILNLDDPLIASKIVDVKCRLRTFGLADNADYRAVNLSASWPDRLSFDLIVKGEQYHVQTRFLGKHHIICVLAAIAAADVLGVDLGAFITELASIEPVSYRMIEHSRADGIVLIRDHFKASQYMIDDSVEFLRTAKADNKYLVVGHLSDTAKKEGSRIRRVARTCQELGINLVVIGEQRRKSIRRERYGFQHGLGAFESATDVANFINEKLTKGDLVLIKAGRIAKMERIALSESQKVLCKAYSCGRDKSCYSCPVVAQPNPYDFKFSEHESK